MFTVLIFGNIDPKKMKAFSRVFVSISEKSKYYPIEISKPFSNEPIHPEDSGGAYQFYSAMNCNYLAYLNCLPESCGTEKYSCSRISEDLTDYFVKVKDSSEFLKIH